MNMLKIENGSCGLSELQAVAALFYKKLSADPVFRAAFPDPAVGRAHCREFTAAYAQAGEIHRATEDGNLAAAALWSLPGQAVPSPTWDFQPEEPCCKLYLMVSRRPGAGSALLDYAAGRFAGLPFVTLCGTARQAAYFRRRGFEERGKTAFGTMLIRECGTVSPETIP
jgi:hypothetical protein